MLIRTACVVTLLALSGQAAAQPVTIVARQGVTYPTLPPGVVIETLLRDQFVAPDGGIVVYGYVSAPGGAAKAAVAVPPGGLPLVLAQERNTAGGTPGWTFSFINPPIALSGTRAAVSSILSGNGITWLDNSSLFIASQSGQTPLALWQQSAPGGPPGSFFGTAWPIVATDSSAAFSSVLFIQPPTIAARGIWVWTPSGLGAAAVSGQQAPGFAAGIMHNFFLDPMRVNSSGRVVFNGTTNVGHTAVWSGTPGNIARVVARNDTVPGLTPPLVFSSFTLPSINSEGDIVFTGGYVDPAADPPPRTGFGVWKHAKGVLTRFAATGDAAPGTSVSFASVGTGNIPLFINADGGHVAFRATLSGLGVTSSNNTGVWAGRLGQLRLVARAGSQAAGLPPGVIYSSIQQFAVNGRGQVVFWAILSGPGVIPGNNDRAIFYSQPDGFSAPILRMRDLAGAGEVVNYFEFPQLYGSGVDGQGAVLNDRGEFVFYLQFLNVPRDAVATFRLPDPCYANCDHSTGAPLLTSSDFVCFVNAFAAGYAYANCDGSNMPPVISANDLLCFVNRFAGGCE